MKFELILFGWLLLSTSCQNSSSKDEQSSAFSKNTHVVKEFFADGTLRFEYECIDSIPNGKAVQYFPDQQIKAKANYVNGKLNGRMTSYWENGLVKQVANYKDDKPQGDVEEFYQSGNLMSRRRYHNGMQVGKHSFLFDMTEERIHIIKEYVIVDKEAYLNYEKEFDVDRRIIKESPKVSFRRHGDSLQIELEHKMFKDIRGIVGDYNVYFQSKNQKLDTIVSKDGMKIVIPLTKDTIRGFIENFEFIDKDKGVSRDIWFSYPESW